MTSRAERRPDVKFPHQRLQPQRPERQNRIRVADVTAAPGLLVVLTGGDEPCLDMLVSTARRRYAGASDIAFPARIATRASGIDEELIAINRRVFRDIEKSSGFAVAWQHAGQNHGLTAGALQALEAGHMAVVAAPREALPRLMTVWPRVEVLVLSGAMDRMAPAGAVRESGDGAATALTPTRIALGDDIAAAARRFHAVLDLLRARELGAASRGI